MFDETLKKSDIPDEEDASSILIVSLLEKGNLPTVSNHQYAPGTVQRTGNIRVKKIDKVPILMKFKFYLRRRKRLNKQANMILMDSDEY